MNRENKLALIIGFTLILVVGVLVSDHLSRANSTELGSGPSVREVADRTPISGSLIGETIAAGTKPPVEPVRLGAGVDRLVETGGDGMVIREPETPVESGPRFAITDPNPSPVEQAVSTLASAGGEAWDTILGMYENSATPRMPATVEISREGPRQRIEEPPVREVAPGESGLGSRPVGAGMMRTSVSHTVAEGDNLYRIAKRYLGNGERWREIRDANRGVVGEDGAIGVGDELRIPILEPLDPAPSAGRSAPREVAAPVVRDDRPIVVARTKEYVVKKGDILGRIAQEHLGTVKRVDEIVKLNGLKDENDIRWGMTLRLPAE
ncbi:MAG: LysM peptidoglycan-binding domain-containing protein [Phycisphaerales bacterium JB040]